MTHYSDNKLSGQSAKYSVLRLARLARLGMVLLLLLAVFTGVASAANAQSVQQEAVSIEITAPSAIEQTIAPGRHFRVAGTLTGKVPDESILKVALLDETGRELRFATANQKGTDHVIPSVIGGNITVFNKDTDFSEVAYTAPEMVVADPENPDASARDATVKCVFTDETFYALIVSATDTAHGLAEADGYGLVDHEGKPYDALPEGHYRLQVTLSSVDGKEIASASKEIEIGRTTGTIIHEITNPTAIKKGGKALLLSWVADNDLTILDDLLPGFFGIHYDMTTMPMSVSCETAEYLPGSIHMLIYGNKTTSTSYALEVAKYLQLEHNVENPDIAEYYYFDLGEPSFAEKHAKIVEFGEDERIHVCRIDHVEDETQDGIFLTTEEQILESDTDPSDGWTATDGAFAVAGVMKPYQLRDDELVPDDDIYEYYCYLNGADSLVYTFTPADGSDSFSIEKAVGVSRIDAPDKEKNPAVYEFYNVFQADTLKAGQSYDVNVQAYDRKGEAIKGACCQFTMNYS